MSRLLSIFCMLAMLLFQGCSLSNKSSRVDGSIKKWVEVVSSTSPLTKKRWAFYIDMASFKKIDKSYEYNAKFVNMDSYHPYPFGTKLAYLHIASDCVDEVTEYEVKNHTAYDASNNKFLSEPKAEFVKFDSNPAIDIMHASICREDFKALGG